MVTVALGIQKIQERDFQTEEKAYEKIQNKDQDWQFGAICVTKIKVENDNRWGKISKISYARVKSLGLF